ncbi:MAG: tRNA 2-thiocytidine(32) synthetase TtcA, partial [Clostridia bacterium]|nr:tRNA 2-thiocytidine(32) synthetase TtcA [Clostridia bacterium]
FDCFRPITYLDRSDMTVIRPLLYTPEKEVTHFVRASRIAPVPKNCPADGITKREDAKVALSELERKDRGVKQRIFNAYFNAKREDQV